MAKDSSGAKNQPLFAESGAPQIGTDLSLVSNYAAGVGNHKVGTTADKTALSGADLWEGLSFYDTSVDKYYVYNGSAWKELFYAADLPAELPDPQTAFNGTVYTITSTSTSFATLPGTEVKFDVTLSASCWYHIEAGCWLSTSGDDVRFGIKMVGAHFEIPSTPSWGAVLIGQNGTSTSSGSVSKTLILPSGTTTVYCAAYRSSASGTNSVAYPYLTATPIKWA